MKTWKQLAPIALSLALASAAAAHGKKEASTPADGATIATAPETLVVRFDQPHRVTLLEIEGPNGAKSRLTVTQGMTPTREITAEPPEIIEPGDYRLTWRALAEDGHMVEDGIGFTYAPSE